MSILATPFSSSNQLIVINELSVCFRHALHDDHLSGIIIGPNYPTRSRADVFYDSVICRKADIQEVTVICPILHDFCNLSGQTPNWNNSSILFRKISTKTLTFPSKDLQPTTIHLGNLSSLIKETKTTSMSSYTINFQSETDHSRKINWTARSR